MVGIPIGDIESKIVPKNNHGENKMIFKNHFGVFAKKFIFHVMEKHKESQYLQGFFAQITQNHAIGIAFTEFFEVL